ncbi:unnamed protein product [Spirodela intermedia]|uniref:Uncharacterized protein n=1 Tax=Spirodela intermedia TaxID=51605 RepID=A0ABN7EB36_SPIIN|nr:unnamed protein product [Spirodela intermedia]CAA6674714.1 unnamed protein product [Spirodela intermedia]
MSRSFIFRFVQQEEALHRI